MIREQRLCAALRARLQIGLAAIDEFQRLGDLAGVNGLGWIRHGRWHEKRHRLVPFRTKTRTSPRPRECRGLLDQEHRRPSCPLRSELMSETKDYDHRTARDRSRNPAPDPPENGEIVWPVHIASER